MDQVQTESAERLMDSIDRSLTVYMRCLIRYWLWLLQGSPVSGSDVEVCLELVAAGREKAFSQTIADWIMRGTL